MMMRNGAPIRAGQGSSPNCCFLNEAARRPLVGTAIRVAAMATLPITPFMGDKVLRPTPEGLVSSCPMESREPPRIGEAPVTLQWHEARRRRVEARR